tara:strand:+ start:938 stop:2104 length:1167 start_codon:yes stop_codon:yes gene_type:complete
MSEFQASNFKKAQGGGAPDIVGKVEFTSPYFFVPPSGDTASRPVSCAPGTIRFNTDVGTIEVYRGDTIGWEFIERRDDQYLGGGTGSNTGRGTRGLFTGSSSPGSSVDINQVTISTLGNSSDFGGDLAVGRIWGGGTGNRTRAITINGYNQDNTIQFGHFSSGSDFTDFGDSTVGRHQGGSLNNQIRAMFLGGGTSSRTDIMDYITMSQTGNAVDFGNLSSVAQFASGVSSSTRGLIAGGYRDSSGGNPHNTIDFITITTTGNASDFGDLTVLKAYMGTATSATRGVFAGGQSPNDSNPTEVIDFVTMATTGNAVDFGNLITAMGNQDIGVVSDCIRGLFARGYDNPTEVNTIEFVDIATTGNGQDFGDCNGSGTSGGMAMSNGHGGL